MKAGLTVLKHVLVKYIDKLKVKKMIYENFPGLQSHKTWLIYELYKFWLNIDYLIVWSIV